MPIELRVPKDRPLEWSELDGNFTHLHQEQLEKLPTKNEKLALRGTYGQPSNTNRYITQEDPDHNPNLSLYRLNKDQQGIYKYIEYRRQDGTLAKMSILSGGVTPKYSKRTVYIFDDSEDNYIKKTEFELIYDSQNEFIGEVLL